MALRWQRSFALASLAAQVILGCLILVPAVGYGIGCLGQPCVIGIGGTVLPALELFTVLSIAAMCTLVARWAAPLLVGIVFIAVEPAAAAYGLLVIQGSPEWLLAWLLASAVGLVTGTAVILSLWLQSHRTPVAYMAILIALFAGMATLSWQLSRIGTPGRCPGTDVQRTSLISGTVELVESIPESLPPSRQNKIVFLRDYAGAQCVIEMAGNYRPDLVPGARVTLRNLVRGTADGNLVPVDAPPSPSH